MSLYFTMDVDVELDCLRPHYRKNSGNLGLTKGIPVLLEIFEKREVNATFFVQEQTCQNFGIYSRYPEVLKQISDHGHEIGLHVHILDGSYMARKREITYGYQRLRKIGYDPVSFRAGWHFTNEKTIRVLEECGMRYDCSPWKNRCSGPMAWYDLPHSPYHPSYSNVCKIGKARVLVIPTTDYRLGIDLEFPLNLMKKGTEVLIEKSRQIDAPIIISLTMHSFDCIDPINNLLNESFIQKLDAFLSFVSSYKIEKTCIKTVAQLWEDGDFEPYYLELPDLLKSHFPVFSSRKYLWAQKNFLCNIPRMYYLLFRKIPGNIPL